MPDFVALMSAAKAHLERGDQAKDKAEQHYISAGIELRNAKAAKPAGMTWPNALLEYGIKKTRAYQLIAIADGRTSVAQEREDGAAKKRLARNVRDVPDNLSQKETDPNGAFGMFMIRADAARNLAVYRGPPRHGEYSEQDLLAAARATAAAWNSLVRELEQRYAEV